MSSILKALRKVEDEKATLGQGSVDLAHDILKRGYDDRKSAPWARLVVFSLVFIAIVATAAWWFWGATEVATPDSPAVVLAPPVKAEPARQSPVVVKEIAIKATVKAQTPVDALVEKPQLSVVKEVRSEKPASAEEPPPMSIPDLQVDEIVYHEIPSSRLAVINDLPVMEGTDIMGVRIVEILPDRVQCSYRGIIFYKFKVEP